MSKINWKEVAKFLSGAFFVSAGTNGYFYALGVSVPFFGYTATPEFLGFRTIVHSALFALCFYYGFLRK